MDVLLHANQNYELLLHDFPDLKNQKNVIITSSILHDMCDKKYLNEKDGLSEIEIFLKNKLNDEELYFTKEIISTMSYSTIKKNGFPNLGHYQLAYHIVREADLLSSYNFDRALIYNLHKSKEGKHSNLKKAYDNALNVFHNRVFNYNKDNLLLTKYAQQCSIELTQNALKRINIWKQILYF
jgi:hypothetical protein